MRRVDYVIHYVDALMRSVTFYRDVIGLQVRIEGDGYVEFELDNTKFSLFDRSKLPGLIGREGGNPPCGEIGFLIEEVDSEAERLRGLGVEILSGPVDRPWHERTLHIADQDGNIIEFAQKLRGFPQRGRRKPPRPGVCAHWRFTGRVTPMRGQMSYTFVRLL